MISYLHSKYGELDEGLLGSLESYFHTLLPFI